MAKQKIVKCKYSKCLHETKEINREDAVLVGKATFYHKDCYKQKEDIAKIIDIFVQKINPNVVIPALRKTVNTIVFEKGISADMLLFGINYYINHRIPLNYPGGLFYVIQNKNMMNEYNRLYQKANIKTTTEITQNEPEVSFSHRPVKMKSITDILG